MNTIRACLTGVVLTSLLSCAAEQRQDGMERRNGPETEEPSGERGSATAARIDPREAKRRVDSGGLLVCAYDSPEKFQANHLQGALSLDQLQSRESALAKETDIIFYCA